MPLSEERKRKISESVKKAYREGRIKSGFLKLKGKKLSPERREKAIKNLKSNNRKGKIGYWLGKKNIKNSGKNCHLYRHGKTSDKKYVSWLKNQRYYKLKTTGGSHTYGEWETLKAQYNYTCPMCLKKEPDVRLTQDHIIPVSKGGSNNIENIQPLCRSCNSSKGAKLIGKVQVDNIS